MSISRPSVFVHLLGSLTVLCLCAPLTLAQPQKFDSINADRVKEMLREAHEEVKKNYYDPKFHGVDWDARYDAYNEKMKQVSSLGQGFSLVAGLLDGLNDSHTFFLPPQRPIRVEYGFQIIMVGDKPLILRVRPGTDAESKVHPGDEVLALNKFIVNREALWKMDYFFKVLSPQSSLDVVLRDPQGQQRDVKIDSKVQQLKRVVDLTHGDDIWDMIREAENADHQSRQRYYEINDVMIWQMPGFFIPDDEVDHLFGIARKHKALILDLRENPGGLVSTLDRMLGNVFEDDVKVGDRNGRKENKPQIAKGRGKSAFTGKLIVLVDSKSASSAEIFARVVQLEHRGTVVGDRSSGSVMEARRISESQGSDTRIFYGFSLTISDLIMKDGKSLEHVGVTPDETVLPTAADIATSRDPALAHAGSLVGLSLEPAQAGKLFPHEWLPF